MSVIKRIVNLPLLVKVLVAIGLGLLCSTFFPVWLSRVFVTANSIIGNFINMFVPVLILGLISSGIADLGKGAGRLLLFTTVLAYLSTVLAGLFSYGVCAVAYPYMIEPGMLLGANVAEGEGLTPYFDITMPPFIDVTTALIIAFVVGVSVIYVKADTLKNCCDQLRDIVMLVIAKVIVPLLPLFIFGIFLKMAQEGMSGAGMSLLAKIIVLIVGMHITVLVLQYVIAGLVTHRNPFKALIKLLPAYATALGTSSSAATIPVTLAQTKKLGVRPEIADFTVPLCATIHMPCSMLKITACAVALMMCMGMPVTLGLVVHFVMIASITLVAAPGVPGGSIMAALGPLSAILGFDAGMQAVMIALYIAMDSFGTAGNVTGDGAISIVADYFFARKHKVGSVNSPNK